MAVVLGRLASAKQNTMCFVEFSYRYYMRSITSLCLSIWVTLALNIRMSFHGWESDRAKQACRAKFGTGCGFHDRSLS